MSFTKNEEKILDIVTSYDFAKLFNNKNTKVMVKKSPVLGTELVCTKPIKKREVIAYYVETKSGRSSSTLVGDLFPGSLEMPTEKSNITYYAFFSNEPTPQQKQNCYLDSELKLNYKNRSKVKAGDTMIYSLRASHDIKPGEAIVWCYGPEYERHYKPSKECL
jgi:hypothetical protein